MRDRPAAASPRPLLPLWAAVPAAAAGGLALDAAFPELGIWPLAFLAVGLSLASLIGRRVGGALLVGLAFGAAFWFPHLDWAARFLGDHPLAWVPWTALAGVQTLFSALGAIPISLAYRWFPDRRVPRLTLLPLLVGAVWTARELVMGNWPYGGFPWARLGMTQSEGPFAAVASWLGVSGLSFLMAVLTAALLELARVRPVRLRSLLPAVALALVLVLTPQWQTGTAGTMRVGAVQGNGPAAYFDERSRGDILAAQLEASQPLRHEDVDVVLWPEGGVDSDPRADRATALTLRVASRAFGAPILLNAASEEGDLVYNTSMLWTEDGLDADGGLQTHAKRHPVPFGEYVPDREFYGAIVPDLIGLIGREYTPGTDAPVVDVDAVRIGLAICFDVIYDDVIREGAREGAQVFMFQTNNADFRGTDENLQQLAFARMRAIETGRTVVNLSTVGTSQVIAPDGTTMSALGVDEAGLLVSELELREGLTPAVVLGPWVQAALLAGSLAALVLLGLARAFRRGGARDGRGGSRRRPRAAPRRPRSDVDRVVAMFR
ncbi:apolipoprotein N-acyltransferase [Microbacterium album]|uniref:Apolipoprotein N-acyltransferase n=1 Tax=Microbacterium album TaxID=2053191 RepID=A0A917IEA4_9MICO|nr:apolipoprotein N-acyltransferase [Microbacterium album]GGH35234.1 apolipoprotein N-acyltransferase [Microbacterium album]